ncbi:LruC domain-containing protein [Psychromonas hadalis]|uniref:LruC domain-containing protein n=1 Tax=Psychromonas hadalis TaxID=211669 RepID=UPI0004043D87|nr:LruC domain-containing protein [Psychromonas hadalis]
MKFIAPLFLLLTGLLPFTVVADPQLQAQQLDILTPDYKQFAAAVALSENTTLIGAPGLSNASGQACLYQRIEQTWDLSSCLTPLSANAVTATQFGKALSISGEQLIISANKKQTGQNGVVYIFEKITGIWVQQAELINPSSVKNDHFGATVSISKNYAAIGSQGIAASHQGAVHIITKSAGTWVADVTITPESTYKSAHFGSSLMLSGEFLIIGDNEYGRAKEGAAYIYRRVDDIWQKQASLMGGHITKSAKFGSSVAISSTYAVVGARAENNPEIKKNKKSGAVYVYKRTGSVWALQTKLIASDAAMGDNFGSSVAISGDHIIVGSENSNNSRGSAYLFQESDGIWKQLYKFSDEDAATQDTFGHALSINEDYVVIGANNKSMENNNEGNAYIYYLNRDTSPSLSEQTLSNTLLQLTYNSVLLDSDGDGLSDMDEINILGTDPMDSDSDNDGLTDREEITIYQSDPQLVDTDNDGLTDLEEAVIYHSDPTLIDSDNDGFTDFDEVMFTKTDPTLVDSDNDGFTDQQEITEMNTSPILADTDGDGLTDNEEINIFNTDPVVADSDNDGFSDGNEVYFYETSPLDSSDVPTVETQSTSFSPAQGQYGTIAFEDEWPLTGDYDFNDAVFDYNVEESKVDGLIQRIVFKVLPVARGAAFDNSLRMLINTPISNIANATMKLKGTTRVLMPIADGNQSLFIIIESIKDALPPPPGYQLSNTFSGSLKVTGHLYTLSITFNSPISSSALGSAPYNSFLSRVLETGEHIEVHFPGYFPSKQASKRKFGSQHDDSNQSQDRYYQTKENLPWAMSIPAKWHHPKEHVDLSNGYPDILNWASSKGKKNKNWYKSKRNSKFVFDSVSDL